MARYLQFVWAVLLLLFPVSSSMATQRIEAESCYDYGDIPGRGLPIRSVPCPEASGRYGVDGVDCNRVDQDPLRSLEDTFLTALRRRHDRLCPHVPDRLLE
jgi:hypothetical protein